MIFSADVTAVTPVWKPGSIGAWVVESDLVAGLEVEMAHVPFAWLDEEQAIDVGSEFGGEGEKSGTLSMIAQIKTGVLCTYLGDLARRSGLLRSPVELPFGDALCVLVPHAWVSNGGDIKALWRMDC